MRHQDTTAEEVIGRIASAAHGVVTRAELLSAGLTLGEVRAVLHGDAHVTLSRLEKRFLTLLECASLPLPNTNRPAGGRRVDCRWPEHRLTVELDSYRYHRSRHAWETDRRREREAYARGDQFRRYTYGDVFEREPVVVRELEPLLTPA